MQQDQLVRKPVLAISQEKDRIDAIWLGGKRQGIRAIQRTSNLGWSCLGTAIATAAVTVAGHAQLQIHGRCGHDKRNRRERHDKRKQHRYAAIG